MISIQAKDCSMVITTLYWILPYQQKLETTMISIVDHDGNEKVYDFEMLQDLGLHQQIQSVK